MQLQEDQGLMCHLTKALSREYAMEEALHAYMRMRRTIQLSVFTKLLYLKILFLGAMPSLISLEDVYITHVTCTDLQLYLANVTTISEWHL